VRSNSELFSQPSHNTTIQYGTNTKPPSGLIPRSFGWRLFIA
jgi:hypothetical protein